MRIKKICRLNKRNKMRVHKYLKGKPCALCGLPINRDDFSIDHIVPRSKGGTNRLINLQPAHIECNSRKADRHEDTAVKQK